MREFSFSHCNRGTAFPGTGGRQKSAKVHHQRDLQNVSTYSTSDFLGPF
ncbi:MAG: hypothetical protein OZSIB_1668 [Candidatus Ozemobacter sibiricus]|uniref:Uncharacterized protein n=1 Tax=Candidatus Ozemobacter sibiricus TaxID=2268124 RepID=A0A367Z732_9BACT|nr:MAG: hypothetical protein OZSIB_1668 [Candidatus Ozemobacter sibiricus]